MIERFWEHMGEALAGQWAARMWAPAFAFWGGGLLAYAWRHGWGALLDWWAARSTPEQTALLVGALLGGAFSALVMERSQDSLLRAAEGYWPGLLRPLRFALARRWAKRIRHKEERWQALAEKCDAHPERLSPEEQSEYARLDAERAYLPVNTSHLMPTLLGNILRAMEEYPQVRYGLMAGVCWPRLWLLLPQEARQEINTARARLNEAARLFGWGLLFVAWTVWAWWAALVGLAAAALAYRWMVLAALVYGDLVRAAFDLYRDALYEALHWPKGEDERQSGEALTQFLWRGMQPGASGLPRGNAKDAAAQRGEHE